MGSKGLRLKPTEICDGNYHRNKKNAVLIEWHHVSLSKIMTGIYMVFPLRDHFTIENGLLD